MSDAASRLLNLYQLLGLAPLESDRAKIAAAIKRLQKPEGKEAASGSEESQRIEKIAALAQKYLLDPERKAAYDQQWKAVFQAKGKTQPTPTTAEPTRTGAAKVAAAKARAGDSASKVPATAAAAVPRAAAVAAAAVTPSTAAWDYSRLDALLPAGDPQAAFDMANFLRSGGESRDPLAAQADLTKLLALLADAASSGGTSSASATTLGESMTIGRENPQEAGEYFSVPPGALGGHSVGNSSGGLARRVRQRKQRALIIGGAALATGLGGLVLLAIYLFGHDSEPAATQLAHAGQTKQQAMRGSGLPKIDLSTAPRPADAASPPTVGSGLPKPGEGALSLEVDTTASTAESPGAMAASSTVPTPEPKSEPNANNPAPMQTVAAAPAAPSLEPEPKPTSDLKPTGEPEPEPEPASAPAADAELTQAEKQAWQKGITKAKGLIGEHKFAEAEQQLSELKPAAATALQRGQLERLEQVLGFVKDIRQAMVDAIAELDAAETFMVGTSTVASFVEGNEERITVRVAGRNLSSPLKDVPVGLALGLVDLKMDVEHPATLARKGAYVLIQANNRMTVKQGKEMLQAAAAAGEITPELAAFDEDDYSLSEKPN